MTLRSALRSGLVIPAHPLALTARRRLDERRQRALTRYYLAAGSGGLAVGVHTTQFALHDAVSGLLQPVLELAIETARARRPRAPCVMIAGVVGRRAQALREASLARDLGYDAVLVSLGALASASDDELIAHVDAVANVLPVIGFYVQPAVGGRKLGYRFWRRLAEVRNVVAIKIAPFNRYATLDVVRGVVDAGRAGEIALYTGNDDHILLDLVTTWQIGKHRTRMVGGLLGQWACWTHTAVRQHARCRRAALEGRGASAALLTLAAQVTDANGAIFDASHDFRGCIPGIHEILRRQGLLAGRWCLDPGEELSPGQSAEIDRVGRTYPWLADDEFVRNGLDEWMR